IKGESLFAFVVLSPASSCDLGGAIETLKELNDILRVEIGPIAKIEKILYTPGLPKTRSGKIMRRILRTIARGEEIKQDISTLEDSKVVETIVKLAKAEFE
ncbi:TPA: acetyl-coenzyme A synthetase, partial [Campylobacter jejuni]|nr:acetyl-coenzyme A synthetase [Campylobacter jejuni]